MFVVSSVVYFVSDKQGQQYLLLQFVPVFRSCNVVCVYLHYHIIELFSFVIINRRVDKAKIFCSVVISSNYV
jgi:hypothetical protein